MLISGIPLTHFATSDLNKYIMAVAVFVQNRKPAKKIIKVMDKKVVKKLVGTHTFKPVISIR